MFLVIKKLYKNNHRILMLLHTCITEQTRTFIWQHIKAIVLVGICHFPSGEYSDSK